MERSLRGAVQVKTLSAEDPAVADDEAKEGTMAYAFLHPEVIDAALARSCAGVALLHKLLGYPVVVGVDGKIVVIPPEDIEVPPGAKLTHVHSVDAATARRMHRHPGGETSQGSGGS